MTNVDYMPEIETQASSQASSYRRVIRSFGIAEVVFGFIAMLFGMFALIFYIHTFGEGIWCGSLVVIAGIIGIRAGSKHSSVGMIQANLILSIIGSVIAFVLLVISLYLTAALYFIKSVRVLAVFMGIQSFVAFILMIFLIVDAVVSCCLSPSCWCMEQRPEESTQVTGLYKATHNLTPDPSPETRNNIPNDQENKNQDQI